MILLGFGFFVGGWVHCVMDDTLDVYVRPGGTFTTDPHGMWRGGLVDIGWLVRM